MKIKDQTRSALPYPRSIEAGQKLNLRRKSSKSFHDKTRLGRESSFKYNKRTKKFYALLEDSILSAFLFNLSILRIHDKESPKSKSFYPNPVFMILKTFCPCSLYTSCFNL